jgi:hypothetical protein
VASFGIIFLPGIHRFGTVLYCHIIPGNIIAAAQLRWTTDHGVPDQDSNQCSESGSGLDPDSSGPVGIQAG